MTVNLLWLRELLYIAFYDYLVAESGDEFAEKAFYIALEIHCNKWDQVHILFW